VPLLQLPNSGKPQLQPLDAHVQGDSKRRLEHRRNHKLLEPQQRHAHRAAVAVGAVSVGAAAVLAWPLSTVAFGVRTVQLRCQLAGPSSSHGAGSPMRAANKRPGRSMGPPTCRCGQNLWSLLEVLWAATFFVQPALRLLCLVDQVLTLPPEWGLVQQQAWPDTPATSTLWLL